MVPPFTAEIVAVSPTEPPVTEKVGVVSFVMLSVTDEPVSLEAARSGVAGATGAEVSTVMESGDDDEVFPDRSDNVDVMLHVPSERVGRSHEEADPTVNEHVLVVLPSVAEIVMVSSVDPPLAVIVGVVSLVRLSVLDVPESLAADRSGVPAVPAVVSMVNDREGLAVDVLPAGSVSVDVTVHAPSERVGRSHEEAEPIT